MSRLLLFVALSIFLLGAFCEDPTSTDAQEKSNVISALENVENKLTADQNLLSDDDRSAIVEDINKLNEDLGSKSELTDDSTVDDIKEVIDNIKTAVVDATAEQLGSVSADTLTLNEDLEAVDSSLAVVDAQEKLGVIDTLSKIKLDLNKDDLSEEALDIIAMDLQKIAVDVSADVSFEDRSVENLMESISVIQTAVITASASDLATTVGDAEKLSNDIESISEEEQEAQDKEVDPQKEIIIGDLEDIKTDLLAKEDELSEDQIKDLARDIEHLSQDSSDEPVLNALDEEVTVAELVDAIDAIKENVDSADANTLSSLAQDTEHLITDVEKVTSEEQDPIDAGHLTQDNVINALEQVQEVLENRIDDSGSPDIDSSSIANDVKHIALDLQTTTDEEVLVVDEGSDLTQALEGIKDALKTEEVSEDTLATLSLDLKHLADDVQNQTGEVIDLLEDSPEEVSIPSGFLQDKQQSNGQSKVEVQVVDDLQDEYDGSGYTSIFIFVLLIVAVYAGVHYRKHLQGEEYQPVRSGATFSELRGLAS